MEIYFVISLFLTFVFVGLRYPLYLRTLRDYKSLLSSAETFCRSEDDKSSMSLDFKKELQNEYQRNYRKCVSYTKQFFWLPIPIVFLFLSGFNYFLKPELMWNNVVFYVELIFLCFLAVPDMYCHLSYYSAPVVWIRNDFILKISLVLTLIVLSLKIVGILL